MQVSNNQPAFTDPELDRLKSMFRSTITGLQDQINTVKQELQHNRKVYEQIKNFPDTPQEAKDEYFAWKKQAYKTIKELSVLRENLAEMQRKVKRRKYEPALLYLDSTC